MNPNFENVKYWTIAQLVHEHPVRFAMMLDLHTVGKPNEKSSDDLCRSCLLKLGYTLLEINLLHARDFKVKELTHEDFSNHQRIRKIADDSLNSSTESPSWRRSSSPALIPQSSGSTSAPIDMRPSQDSLISIRSERRKGSGDSLPRLEHSSSSQALLPSHLESTAPRLFDSLKTTEAMLSLPNQIAPLLQGSPPEDHASTPGIDTGQSENSQDSPSNSQDEELMFKLE